MNSLFAYGTLRDSDVLEGVLGHSVAPARLKPATAKGYAVVFFPGRTYPAIRREESAIAPGVLIEGISEAEWLCLDGFEGDEYRRGPIEITVEGRLLTTGAYWPAIDIGITPPWRFEDWQARSKAGFFRPGARFSTAAVAKRLIFLATETPHAAGTSTGTLSGRLTMTQRRTVLKGLSAAALLPLASRAFAQNADLPVNPDDIETDSGDIIIQPVNHATLVLTYDSDVIYFDPVGGAKRYLPFNRPTAILVTHAHPDHFDVPTLEALAPTAKVIIAPQVVIDALPADLKAKAKLMKNGDKGDVNGLPLSAIPAYNTTPGRTQYHPKGVGNGYILSLGEAKVYVAGDTEDTPEMRALTGIGVAFLPMNLPYTMTGDQAASAVKQFKPLMVYPYHYGKDGAEPAKFAAALKGTAGIQVRQRDWYAYS